MLVDVTERKQMEDELRQSQKLQSIGTLAGGIAHDLNNLLVPILGLTELTMEDMDKSDRHYRNLGNVIAAAERARRLVEQILAFSRRDTPSRRPVQAGRHHSRGDAAAALGRVEQRRHPRAARSGDAGDPRPMPPSSIRC